VGGLNRRVILREDLPAERGEQALPHGQLLPLVPEICFWNSSSESERIRSCFLLLWAFSLNLLRLLNGTTVSAIRIRRRENDTFPFIISIFMIHFISILIDKGEALVREIK
jgi:hypothetical protein